MSEGYISIYRQIQNHWTWQSKPFSEGQAWIDLIMLANHKDNKFRLGKELVTVDRGSLITSELKLMERWGWSKSKIRSFGNLLENDKMIIKKTDHKKTTITILNYDDYQINKTTEKPQKNHTETTEEPREDTNNNDNNILNSTNLYIYNDWLKVKEILQMKFTDQEYTNFIKTLAANKLENNILYLETENLQKKGVIEVRFKDKLMEISKRVFKDLLDVKFVVSEKREESVG